jgi:imidazole glycerol-phosphate synthase subunit HisF
MLAKRIVACLDIRGGRVVKGVRFRELRDAGDPAEAARAYCRQGADELVVFDVSATLEDRIASCAAVELIAQQIDVPLTVGGGVRDIADVQRLLAAGADKVAMNSAAVANPRLLTHAANRFGSQCVVLSIDARRVNGSYEVSTHSANRHHPLDAIDWARRAQGLGAGEVVLTSIDRDGTRDGFDLDLTRRAAGVLHIPLVASGGASDCESFADVLDAGADAALGASIFHFGEASIADVKRFCAQRGIVVRP